MLEEQDKLFDITPEQEPSPDRPGLDMDYFHPEKPAEPRPEPSFQDRIPGDVQDRLRPRREAFERRFDELDHAGMPEAEKQAILRREFPDLRSPEQEEKDEAARLSEDRRRASSSEFSKKQKRSPAQSPSVRKHPGYEKEHPPADEPSSLPELTDAQFDESARIAKRYLGEISDRIDREEIAPQTPPKPENQ